MGTISCISGDARTVLQHLQRHTFSQASWQFLLAMLDDSFGNAGWHRQDGKPDHWCPFDLASWATRLDADKSNLLRTRDQLVARNIIIFTPTGPGTGELVWNLTVSDWQKSSWGGTRPHAGRKPTEHSHLEKNQRDYDNNQSDYAPSLEKESKRPWSPASESIKVTMAERFEPAQEADSAPPRIKVTEERTTTQEPDRSSDRGASSPPPSCEESEVQDILALFGWDQRMRRQVQVLFDQFQARLQLANSTLIIEAMSYRSKFAKASYPQFVEWLKRATRPTPVPPPPRPGTGQPPPVVPTVSPARKRFQPTSMRDEVPHANIA